MFRGREQAHPERGRALLERLFEDLGELAMIEQHPQQEGRNMHMMLAPSREREAPRGAPARARRGAPPSQPPPERPSLPSRPPRTSRAARPRRPSDASLPLSSASRGRLLQ